MLYGRGAGEMPTASAVVSDVIYAATHSEIKYSTFKNTASGDTGVKFISDFISAYYIRLFVDDNVGMLAKMSSIFAKYGVSIVEIAQKPKDAYGKDNERVPLIIITHKTKENSIRNAVAKINVSGAATVEAVIRLEA
jgi:homoserine dehydrogenase